MKQGRASSSGMGATKPATITHNVNVGGVSQIGQVVGKASASKPLYEGRGVEAPPAKLTSHKGGSQGRH